MFEDGTKNLLFFILSFEIYHSFQILQILFLNTKLKIQMLWPFSKIGKKSKEITEVRSLEEIFCTKDFIVISSVTV